MSSLAVAPGSVFARDYLVERALAEGGMGAVYVVRQISTGRQRALKVMQPELVQDDDLRRRFLLEAKIGANIASEHVVEVLVAGIDEATRAPFLVMELLDGIDLDTFLEQRGPLSEGETHELFRQMCHALRRAHAAGIVHRDLKPPNVFLAKPKRAEGAASLPARDAPFHVKVLDFGIAKMTTDATVGGAKTGMIGTPLWMAPEQAEHVPVTPAADVWALGLMLYTCLTGRSFWRSAEQRASLQQIMREMLFDPLPTAGERAKAQGASLPAPFESVISRSVRRRPEQRLPDAGAFMDALEDALRGELGPAVAAEPAASTPRARRSSESIELEEAHGPSLELAVMPSPGPRFAPPPAPMTLSAPRSRAMPGGRAIEVPRPSPDAPPPLLADRGEGSRWWLFYLVPLGVVLLFAGAVYSLMHPPSPHVECRLCTVENGTFANGTMPLRDLRHDIEARFPELDSLCVKEAEENGRAKIHWVIEAGDVLKGATVSGGGRTGECLERALVRRAYPILLEPGGGLGRTEVTYILEWNPSVAPPWSTP